ncbi:MAG: DM13 domain-containing protein [Rhodospirillales bacterium]|nr:DM13 domain-containing protein [Rhodospirillales bacterium]
MKRLLSLVAMALSALALFASPAAAERLASGGFSNQTQRITGGWSIEREADGVYLVLSQDFRTRAAPDLKFFVHTLPAAQITAQNATRGVLIGELPSARGAQRIRLPANVDLARFRSLVLHCEQYTVLWGAGDLR